MDICFQGDCEHTMMEYKDRFLEADIKHIIESDMIAWDLLQEANVFITGATGLIGSLLCRTMLAANDIRNLNIHIYGLIRNMDKAEMIFGEMLHRADFSLIAGDITEPVSMDGKVDYIFHCASVTASRTMVTKPVETLMTAVDGTANMLKLAKDKKVKAFVYVSSMEVYGSFSNLEHDVTEEDLGYINPLSVRSNYPESKRLCENMCIAYFTEYGVPVRIARLAQTFGAGILPGENRVFAQFARSAIRGEDIVLHTQGMSEGNYCYTSDTVKGLLVIALSGKDGEAYNISNPDTHTTIADMAQMVCNDIAGGAIKVIFDIPESNTFGYAADTKMKLDSSKLQALGWKPEIGLREAYVRLIGSIRDT